MFCKLSQLLQRLILVIILHIVLLIIAVIYERIVYTIANIRKSEPNTAYVKIKYIAKNVAATNAGHLSIFSNTIDRIIVAIRSAKNNNNVFIKFLLLV